MYLFIFPHLLTPPHSAHLILLMRIESVTSTMLIISTCHSSPIFSYINYIMRVGRSTNVILLELFNSIKKNVRWILSHKLSLIIIISLGKICFEFLYPTQYNPLTKNGKHIMLSLNVYWSNFLINVSFPTTLVLSIMWSTSDLQEYTCLVISLLLSVRRRYVHVFHQTSS